MPASPHSKFGRSKRLFLFSLVTCCLIALQYSADGQNIVPNPSFEEYSQCPNNSQQTEFCNGWNSWRLTPDYFNACSPSETFEEKKCDVPCNLGGCQDANTGSAYIGLITHPQVSIPSNPYREYLGAELLEDLVIDEEYYISFYTSRGPGGLDWVSTSATNNIGLLFTKSGYDYTNPISTLGYNHLNANEIILDTTSWVHIEGTFIADSAYTHLGLGNWFSNSQTEVSVVVEDGNLDAYYYIDDVCVRSNEDCRANLNGDTKVDVFDLLMLLIDFGCEGDCAANFTCDNTVDIQDVLFFLTVFGVECN